MTAPVLVSCTFPVLIYSVYTDSFSTKKLVLISQKCFWCCNTSLGASTVTEVKELTSGGQNVSHKYLQPFYVRNTASVIFSRGGTLTFSVESKPKVRFMMSQINRMKWTTTVTAYYVNGRQSGFSADLDITWPHQLPANRWGGETPICPPIVAHLGQRKANVKRGSDAKSPRVPLPNFIDLVILSLQPNVFARTSYISPQLKTVQCNISLLRYVRWC